MIALASLVLSTVPVEQCVRHDLGLVHPGRETTVTVEISNDSTSSRRFPRASVSCPSCLEVLAWPEEVGPGQVGAVEVRVSPGTHAGPVVWRVSLHGGEARPVHIELVAVVAGLSVSPDRLALGEIESDAPPEVELDVQWFGPGRLVALSATIDDPGVHVARVSSGRVVLAVHRDLPVGPVRRQVDLSALVEDERGIERVIERSIRMTAKVINSRVDVWPRSVFLGSVVPGQVAVSHLRVEHFGEGVLEVSCDCASIQATLDPVPPSDGRHAVWVRLEAPAQPGLLETAIRVFRDGKEVAAIPVVAFVYRGGAHR